MTHEARATLAALGGQRIDYHRDTTCANRPCDRCGQRIHTAHYLVENLDNYEGLRIYHAACYRGEKVGT